MMHPTLVVPLSFLATSVYAQTLLNGQIFTNGLAIVDAPAPNSPMHAGSVTQVAIEISGDGRLDKSAAIPGSDQSTRFDSLEVYLVSYQADLNITVSAGPNLLAREPDSTVKHWDFNVSTCIPAGSYNLTFYEASHINDEPFFAITAYPVTVMNDRPTDPCTLGSNPLQDFPQPSSPPTQSPWLDSTSIAVQPGDNGAAGLATTFLPAALLGAFIGLVGFG